MGSKTKMVPVVTPEASAAETAAALPPPTPQSSPTAQRGNAANKASAQMAAGFGMNNTILTSPRGITTLGGGDNRGGVSLLGL